MQAVDGWLYVFMEPYWTDNCIHPGLTAGTYTLTVTDSKGCQKVVSVTITQPTKVTVSFSQVGNQLTANAAGGTGHTLTVDIGPTTQTLTVVSGNTYT